MTSPRNTTEGPLGFPLTDRQALALDAVLKSLPKDDAFKYRRCIVAKGPIEGMTSQGERSDVSWITTEDPDRAGDVVISRGMNDSQFRQNSIVTLQHNYDIPPVGKSVWRKYMMQGDIAGVKAKTIYPVKPDTWKGEWRADVAFSLVQADLLRGKSIGLLPTKVHVPTTEESASKRWEKVGMVIDEWILLEYACVYIPAQQNAVLESVSKGLQIPDDIQKILGIDLTAPPIPEPEPEADIPFVTYSTLVDKFEKALDQFDVETMLEKAVQEYIDRKRGRV